MSEPTVHEAGVKRLLRAAFRAEVAKDEARKFLLDLANGQVRRAASTILYRDHDRERWYICPEHDLVRLGELMEDPVLALSGGDAFYDWRAETAHAEVAARDALVLELAWERATYGHPFAPRIYALQDALAEYDRTHIAEVPRDVS